MTTVESLQRQLARIESKMGSGAPAVEAALRRHNARLAVMVWERLDSRLAAIDSPTLEPPKAPDDVRQAMTLLSDDTTERWAEDHLRIEQHQLTQYGHLEYARQAWAFGRDPESMWRNYCVLAFEWPTAKALLREATKLLENAL